MIPYDDLVVALSAWRARQGLPVVHAAGSAPVRSPSAGPRTAPPTPPRPPRGGAAAPPAGSDDFMPALVEDSAYDPAGEDYVVSLAGGVIVEPAESTAIGGPPEPVAEGVLVPKRGKRNPDW